MIRPLSDNVVIRRFEAEEKTKGGIILTSANKGGSSDSGGAGGRSWNRRIADAGSAGR